MRKTLIPAIEILNILQNYFKKETDEYSIYYDYKYEPIRQASKFYAQQTYINLGITHHLSNQKISFGITYPQLTLVPKNIYNYPENFIVAMCALEMILDDIINKSKLLELQSNE